MDIYLNITICTETRTNAIKVGRFCTVFPQDLTKILSLINLKNFIVNYIYMDILYVRALTSNRDESLTTLFAFIKSFRKGDIESETSFSGSETSF